MYILFFLGLIEFSDEPKKSQSSSDIVSIKKHLRNLSMPSQLSDNDILIDSTQISQGKIEHKLIETTHSLSTSASTVDILSLNGLWNNNLSMESSYTRSLSVQKSDISLEAVICSSQICTTCDKIIYDEEVMGAWSADDSNLNIL